MKKLMLCLFIIPLVASSQRAVTKATDHFTYKETADRNLKIYSFKPPHMGKNKTIPLNCFLLWWGTHQTKFKPTGKHCSRIL
jgi:hypothetical protein